MSATTRSSKPAAESSEEKFSDRVCALLMQLSSGKCPITEEMIREEPDENNASVLTGLQLLWEDLNYQAERRAVAEEELRQREARYRALFRQARVCIWDCDLSAVVAALPAPGAERDEFHQSLEAMRAVFAKTTLVGVNSQTLRQFGAANLEELAGKLGALVGPRSLRLLAALFGQLADERRELELEGVLYDLDGAPLNVIFGLNTAEGDLRQCIVTISDVTPLHAAREAAQELAELRSHELARVSNEVERLFYAVSHDLRAPLRGVINLAEWAEEDMEGGDVDEVRDHLRLLKQRVGRLDTMLNDLLSFARVGRTTLPAEEVDVADLMRDIDGGLVTFPEGFRFEWGEMPVIVTQKTLLSQVLLNLVTNALKHHDKKAGVIRAGHELVDGKHHFSISDDGPGIPEAYREKIFDMFATLKPRDEVEGSGMGLAFVHKLVTRRGGSISVSDTPGGGATFTFVWPLTDPT